MVDFVNFAKDHPQCLEFLPDEQDWLHLDKKWICDVLYTLEKEAFQSVINSAMVVRKQKLEHNQNLLVEIRPEFAQALQNTLNFSSKIMSANPFYSPPRQGRLPH